MTMFAIASGASAATVCFIIAMVLWFIAAFVTPGAGPGPWYRGVSWGWAGMFFFGLSLYLGGK